MATAIEYGMLSMLIVSVGVASVGALGNKSEEKDKPVLAAVEAPAEQPVALEAIPEKEGYVRVFGESSTETVATFSDWIAGISPRTQ